MDICSKINRKISDVREMHAKMCRIYDEDIADYVIQGILYQEVKAGNISFKIADWIFEEITK